jgi:GT2 family glycosyltransferase
MATLQERTQISIITVNYEDTELTLNFLKHLGIADDVEIIVVDNSASNTLQQKLSSEIKYIHSEKNKGYGGAVNLGIKESSGEWIMILNNDIETTIIEIKTLVKITQQHSMKLATPKLILSDNTIQHSVGYFDSFVKHPINSLFARPRFIDPSLISNPLHVDVTTGAAMLIHRDVINTVGMFDDTNFFMYFEDIDLCLRIFLKKLDWLFIPEVQMKHLQSVTANKNNNQKKENYKHSVYKYIKKHRSFLLAIFSNILPIY